jgi:hypothetical protein
VPSSRFFTTGAAGTSAGLYRYKNPGSSTAHTLIELA